MDEVHEVGSVAGRGVGVLGERLVGDDPGDLGEVAGQRVRLDRGGDVVGRGTGHRGDGGHAAVVQRVTGLGAGDLREVGETVVAVVVIGILVDLPADTGPLERLGVRLPGQPRLVAAVVAGAVDLAAPQVGAVGSGGAEGGAEVGVAHGVVVCQRVVERYVAAVQVAEAAHVADTGDPVVEPALVPRGVLGGPAVRQVAVALGERLAVRAARGRGGAEFPRVLAAQAVRLVEDGLPAGERDAAAVTEPADALEAAEVVVETAVLLHEDHHVLDVLDGARGGCARSGGGQRGAGRDPGAQRDKTSAADRCHRFTLVSRVRPDTTGARVPTFNGLRLDLYRVEFVNTGFRPVVAGRTRSVSGGAVGRRCRYDEGVDREGSFR